MRKLNRHVKESYEITVEDFKDAVGLSKKMKVNKIILVDVDKDGKEGSIWIETVEKGLVQLCCYDCDWEKVVLSSISGPNRCPGCNSEGSLHAKHYSMKNDQSEEKE